jgi:hypothetical protein
MHASGRLVEGIPSTRLERCCVVFMRALTLESTSSCAPVDSACGGCWTVAQQPESQMDAAVGNVAVDTSVAHKSEHAGTVAGIGTVPCNTGTRETTQLSLC